MTKQAFVKYMGKLLAFLLALCVPFVLLIGFIGFVPETSQQSLLYTLHYKLDLLKDTPGGDRILIAGGSATEYGVECGTIADATGRPTYCVGVTAYLGIDMYLNMLERYAEPGDTVILMLEHLMLRDTGVDYLVLWQACGTDPDAWACVPADLWLGAAASAGRYLVQRWPSGWSPLQGLHRTVYDYAPGQTPHSDAFGPLGDVTEPRANILEHLYNTQDMVALGPGVLDEDNLRSIRNFTGRMEEKGIMVLFSHAPLNALCVTSSAEENAAYAEAVRTSLGLPVLVDYPDAVMDAALFYDSNNHLNSEGAALYTQKLIGSLAGLGLAA